MTAPWGYGNMPSPSPQQFGPQFYQPWAMPAHMQAFTGPNTPPTLAAQRVLPIQQINPMAAENAVAIWCRKFGLDTEERDSLTKLGFKVSDKLDSLSDTLWEWAGVLPLGHIRILEAYAASKEPLHQPKALPTRAADFIFVASGLRIIHTIHMIIHTLPLFA